MIVLYAFSTFKLANKRVWCPFNITRFLSFLTNFRFRAPLSSISSLALNASLGKMFATFILKCQAFNVEVLLFDPTERKGKTQS